MRRQKYPFHFVLLVLTFVINLNAEPAVGRLNIILILTDDLDARMIEYMPNLKALLVDQGTSFDNFFVNVPNCCPSRSSTLRGQFAHNTGITSNTAPNGGFQKFKNTGLEKSTVATWLQKAGYRTVLIGKYLNQYPAGNPNYVPPGWDEWYGGIQGNLYFDYHLNENGKIVKYGHQTDDYETDVFARKATDFINRNGGSSPFFLYLAPRAPHSAEPNKPSIPAPRHQNLLNSLVAPRVISFNEADVSDKPAKIRQLTLMTPNEIATVDEWYRQRVRSMLAVDEMIASVMDTLKEKNLLNNTYVFFSSDNGFQLGEHRIRVGKNTPYDESTRVPLIVFGPGVCPGRVTQRFAQNIDLAPTFAQIAGASLPAFEDGKSLFQILQNKPPSQWKREALLEDWSDTDSIDHPAFRALRTADYLYVEYGDGELELYDVKQDPYQINSIHNSADPSFLSQLSIQLHTLSAASRSRVRESRSK
jgi:N-acetylglucosamine-6-sulfatase